MNKLLTLLTSLKTRKDLVWMVIAVVAFLSGNVSEMAGMFTPILDESFVTHDELKLELDNIKCDCKEEEDNPAVVPVQPNGRVAPRVVPRTDT